MLPQEIIRRKRDGAELDVDDIVAFVVGLVDGSFTESQVAAFAMAVFFRGMSRDETIALTGAMTHSGKVLSWTDLDLGGPVLDKHSTGGVGDKVSLMLAPIVAAAGAYVPMISGRGLGHTGGTLDKLDAIPGYNSTPDHDLFRATVQEVGCAIIGQTAELAPADRRFYAIRDVTATVESIPLITASILSKKLAAGLEGLVMDIKTGSGAFASELSMARDLARSIVEVATGAGLPTRAIITDMNQVLGRTVGNALEVAETVSYLTGAGRDPRLHEVVLTLAGHMLVQGGLGETVQTGRVAAERVLENGAAAELFERMVAALGGPRDFLTRSETYLPRAAITFPVHPETGGMIQSQDVRAYGNAVVELGGGRTSPADDIDPAVGLTEVAGLGERVGPERPLAVIHAADENTAAAVAGRIRAAAILGETGEPSSPMVIETIAGS